MRSARSRSARCSSVTADGGPPTPGSPDLCMAAVADHEWPFFQPRMLPQCGRQQDAPCLSGTTSQAVLNRTPHFPRRPSSSSAPSFSDQALHLCHRRCEQAAADPFHHHEALPHLLRKRAGNSGVLGIQHAVVAAKTFAPPLPACWCGQGEPHWSPLPPLNCFIVTNQGSDCKGCSWVFLRKFPQKRLRRPSFLLAGACILWYPY